MYTIHSLVKIVYDIYHYIVLPFQKIKRHCKELLYNLFAILAIDTFLSYKY